MSELINKEAVMNEIAEWMLEFGGEDEKRERDALQHLAKAVRRMPSANQWIRCEDRLPEMHDAGILKKLGVSRVSNECIITIKDNNKSEYVVDNKAHLRDGKWYSDLIRLAEAVGLDDITITAWMPMPEPFEEDEL